MDPLLTREQKQNPKAWQLLVNYVKKEIWQGNLHPGDRLPTERALAASLQISRNSVREGMRILENIGVVQSVHGSGNFVSLKFNTTMAEMLGFLYFMKSVEDQKVAEFRWMIEKEALPLAIERIDEEQKAYLKEMLFHLEEAQSEKERLVFDREIHYTMVNASQNDFLIANYQALMTFMDRHIADMRQKIIAGMESRNLLEKAHRNLVEGLVEQNLAKGQKGLHDHIGYNTRYQNQ